MINMKKKCVLRNPCNKRRFQTYGSEFDFTPVPKSNDLYSHNEFGSGKAKIVKRGKGDNVNKKETSESDKIDTKKNEHYYRTASGFFSIGFRERAGL